MEVATAQHAGFIRRTATLANVVHLGNCFLTCQAHTDAHPAGERPAMCPELCQSAVKRRHLSISEGAGGHPFARHRQTVKELVGAARQCSTRRK